MKLTITNKSAYAEEGQSNPIRWAILSGSPEEGFVNESAWLKCKDFFNDYCVAYQGGPRFGIYGFSTEKMTIPKNGEPVYMALSGLTKNFLANFIRLREWLLKNNCPDIGAEAFEDKVILEFAPFYFKNTYNISLISLMIRIINDEKFNGTIEELKTYKIPGDGRDEAKWQTAVKKNVFFQLPEKYQTFVWYCSPTHNSETSKDLPVYQLSSLIHNNGLVSWSTQL